MSELVQNCCVVKVPRQPHICSPLSVVSNSTGKQRLVINLRFLNGYLWRTNLSMRYVYSHAPVSKRGMCFHLILSLDTTTLTYLSHADSFWGLLGSRGHKAVLYVHSFAIQASHSFAMLSLNYYIHW